MTNPTAFDAFANDYDNDFTHSKLGQLLRPRVWEKLATHFSKGQHLLELTCGTGEDAVWLAKQGLHITATDGSSEMVNVTRAKAKAAQVAANITAQQISLQQIEQGIFAEEFAHKFDGVYSNFGGLNTIGKWYPLAQQLAKLLKPTAKLVLVPMGPLCPWEIAWHLLHLQPKTAFRRFRSAVPAKIGQTTIPIWYPSANRLKTDFSPHFKHLSTESLELWLPPSYLDHLVNRWPALFTKLNHFEKNTAHLTKGWGDHYIIVFERS